MKFFLLFVRFLAITKDIYYTYRSLNLGAGKKKMGKNEDKYSKN